MDEIAPRCFGQVQFWGVQSVPECAGYRHDFHLALGSFGNIGTNVGIRFLYIQTNVKGEGVPFTYGRVLQSLDAPYFAGYFDGDGSLMLRPEKNRWYPRIAFGQTQPDAVIDLHVIYGGSLKVIKGKGVDPKSILFYQLTQREAVLALLRDIAPFAVEKRDQIQTFLNTYQPNMSFEDGRVLQGRLSAMKRTQLVVG